MGVENANQDVSNATKLRLAKTDFIKLSKSQRELSGKEDHIPAHVIVCDCLNAQSA